MIRKLMMTFVTLAAAAAFAQPTPQTPATSQTPEQRIAHRVEYLTTLLTLQPSQVTQITTIFTDEYKASSALDASVESARTAVRDAVTALANDSTIDRLTAAAASLEGQEQAIHAKAHVKFLTVLTADQRAKLEKFDGPGDGSRGPGGPGGPRGPGPRGAAVNRL
ncbi:MAG: Spy/CpxP family protein refolding chaperone [Bryobacteraceae bacterium]|nr:Spy/CpxP family protein refolding chaperone [Bryobacteraceae bacterium]